MLSKTQSTLATMLAPGEPLLIGVSGGADSVALLDVLVKSGWQPHVCHLNHKLRGAESDADAEFVGQLAQRYGLPATIEACPVVVGGVSNPDRSRLKTAPTVSGSENAARRARFGFFAEVAAKTGISKLALAHTADDQVETFLLRLLRGAGVPGLIGIWPERKIGSLRVIRPMLGVTRAEVLEYLSAQGLTHREDSTNADRRFLRNRIRHELLPLLEREYNPGIRDVLLRTAEILRDEDDVLARLSESALEGYVPSWPPSERTQPFAAKSWASLQVKALQEQPVAVQRRLLRFWLGGEDELGGLRFTFDHIEAARELAVSECPSAEAHLPGEWIVYREYDWLRKATRTDLEPVRGEWPVNPAGETVIRELGVRLRSEWLAPPTDGGAYSFPSGVMNTRHADERFDAEALGAQLCVRTWRAGDRFQPLGMGGEKKLQDFFVDEKVPRRQRGRVPLLCAADGRIAWVVGYRIAEPFKVTEQTRRVLRISTAALQD